MKDKTVIITGSSDGIGKATAVALAKMGANVFIQGRNPDKTEAAAEEIRKLSGNARVDFFVADLSSQKQVRRLAAEIRSRCPRIDVFISNAGQYTSHRVLTEDGIETQFAVNHLAPFLLINLLLDRIRQSAPARILVVSSQGHLRGKIHFDDFNLTTNYFGFTAYAQSKFANVLFTYELARRLSGTGVVANCLHPGVVRTDIGSKGGGWLDKLVWNLGKIIMVSPEKGAETSVYLASSPEAEKVTGKYFIRCRPVRSRPTSYNEELAKRLWVESERLVNLNG